MRNNKNPPTILKEIKLILDKEKIPFWLEAGTLMGAIKYKKIMPWDNDIDLGVFKKDFSDGRIRKLAKIFEKKGFIMHSFPEKIDLFKDKYNLALQIHLIKKYSNKNYFTWKRVGNNDKFGDLLFKLYRLSNVSYYGKFGFKTLHSLRLNLKTNLFKLITLSPKSIRNKLSKFVIVSLSKIKNSGVYYLDIPMNYLSKF